jgi:anaerobic selenocysteine-containing dehydrogenase
LQKSHYDYVLLSLAVRNVANYSPPVLPLEATQISEGDILLKLAAVVAGHRASEAVVSGIDESVADVMLDTALQDSYSNVANRDKAELQSELAGLSGPERLLEIALRTGPFGDGFGTISDGLSLKKLKENPHGIDLGALQEKRIPDILRTPDGKVQVIPALLLPELERMQQALTRETNGDLQLVGRRHVRSNNSWMHNVSVLTSGRNRCTLQIHPDDASRLGVKDGSPTRVTSRVGELVITAECTDVVMPGVVSIPHGFGQDQPGVQLRVAREYDGVNTNLLTDEYLRDEICGNIALNGVPVTVASAE